MPKGVYPHKAKEKIPGVGLGPASDLDLMIQEDYLAGRRVFELAKDYCLSGKRIRMALIRLKTVFRKTEGNLREVNGSWKGGRTIDPSGYVLIKVCSKKEVKDHPMCNSLGYVREHRLVLSKFLGRPLLKEEVVHHKNGDPSDNRLENLLLFSSNGEHLGCELLGKIPKWTEEGKKKILDRSIPSMYGTRQCVRGTGVRLLRRRLIQKFLHDTEGLEKTSPVVELKLPLYHCQKS